MSKTVPTVPLGAADPAGADGSATGGSPSNGSEPEGSREAGPDHGSSAPVRTQPLHPRARTLSGEEAEAARRAERDELDDDDGEVRAGVDPDRAAELIGRILAGRYEVREVLGRGGMGLVYRGWHLAVDRPVAIKVLRRDLARSTDAVARFHREARAAAKIGSEHIVDVFDYNYTDDGDAYIVMELLEGEDLGRVIRREGPLPEARAASIARQVGRALEMAHAKGIIHRDLKSENVFVLQRDGRDYVKLLDFGISKVSEGDEGRGPMTSEGVVMGTPHYMAPEQAISAVEPDHRIDLYALGCLLYEMLTGRVPFTGKNAVEVVFKHVHEAPVPPSRARPGGLSPELEAVVLKLLAKTREERYASAGDFLVALDAARASIPGVGDGGAAPSSTGPQRAEALAQAAGAGGGPARTGTRWDRRRGTWAAAAVTAVSGLGLAAYVATTRPTTTTSTERPARTDADAGSAVPRADLDVVAVRPSLATNDAGATRAEQGSQGGAGVPSVADDAAASLASAPRDTWWTVVVVATPNARVEIDGELHASSTVRELVARGVEHHLVISAPGYATQTHAVRIEHAQTSRYRLDRLPADNAVSGTERGDAAASVSSSGGDAESGANPGSAGSGGDDAGGGSEVEEQLQENPYGDAQAPGAR